jgi:hypothetical protein
VAKLDKLALSLVFLAVGGALLATAAVAGRSNERTGIKDGGTLRLNISTSDIQSIDPGVDYEFPAGRSKMRPVSSSSTTRTGPGQPVRF